MAKAVAGGVNSNNDTRVPVQKRLEADPNALSEYINSGAKKADDAYWAKVAPGMSQQQIAAALRAMPLAQSEKLIQGGFANENSQLHPESGFDKWMQRLALAGSVGALTAGFGAAAGPAIGGAAGGGTAGTIAAGAATGAFGSAASGVLTNGTPNAKQVAMGAIGGGLSAGASPWAKGVSDTTGLSPMISSGLVKGAIGAGTGALGAKLSGGNVGNAALSGGAAGAASGFVGSATGSNIAGSIAGGLGKMAISPLLSGGGTTVNGGSGAGVGYGGPLGILAGGAMGGHATAGGGATPDGSSPGASTDSTLAGTITGALPGLIQGAAGVYGSQNAAEKMTQADQNAIGTQQSTLGNIGNIWKTQQGLGQGADTALGTALGTNGKPADYSGFENTPGYKFAVQQGTQAIQRQAASMGNAYTPNTAAAVGQYVTGTASQNYNNYINQLMGAAGLGSTANAGIATPTYQTGANISQLQQNQGYAQASGVSGAANAIGGAFGPGGVGSSLIGAAGKFLNGGGGGSGGGKSGGNSGVSSSDPFAGTSLANNSNAFNAYNAANGPTYSDIGNLTSGAGDIQPFDSSGMTTPEMPSIDTGNYDFGGSIDYGSSGSDFLGGF